jgi:hypothetical protein
MGRVQLTAVEKNGHWAVRLTWPNRSARYLGEFTSKRDADQWIKQNLWLTAKRIDDKDLARRERRAADTPQLAN